MNPTPFRTVARPLALGLSLALLGGCASAPQDGRAGNADPLERYNRSMTHFNTQVDDAVLKPVATLYRDVTPQPVRTGVRNFFSNLGDAWSAVNNLLQLRGREAYESLVRFNVNTVFGLGGLLDVASEMRIDRHKQDFGLTLGHWGVPTGPYLVLPLLGPSTVRDTAALPVDIWGNSVRHIRPVATRNSLAGLGMVDRRASLLGTSEVLDNAALDKYSFTRDVYLRVRSNADEGRMPNAYDDEAGQLSDDY
ncbi:VacJ family lipoprotein [Melaminivora sp.]|uniref:MlaA family lipoprotein n=1 Tax=Melaminivora sp. TaxID=1933032 RepID=UPI0028A9B088|nr:VacJ family lipoprotein [Melaminivora sp.]